MDEINPYESPRHVSTEGTADKRDGNLQEGVPARAWRTRDFVIALVLQGLLLIFAALLLDGGFLLRLSLMAVITHWIAAGVIVVRRRASPTEFDVGLVRYGFVFWLLFAIVGTIAVSALR
ncbi:MAG: hypothetical protein ACYSWU_13060 [Planctomycetota bacterium]|jgi:hypothetical protein